MNFPLNENDMMLFNAAEAIENTLKSLRNAKDRLKEEKDAFLKAHLQGVIKFEQDKYYKDLSWFELISGNLDWKKYI